MCGVSGAWPLGTGHQLLDTSLELGHLALRRLCHPSTSLSVHFCILTCMTPGLSHTPDQTWSHTSQNVELSHWRQTLLKFSSGPDLRLNNLRTIKSQGTLNLKDKFTKGRLDLASKLVI